METKRKFIESDIFTTPINNGRSIIENIKFVIFEFEESDKLKYLIDVQDCIRNKFKHPQIRPSKGSLLYHDYDFEGIELKKFINNRYNAFCEVENWLNEIIDEIESITSKNNTYSFFMDDEYLKKIALFHEKLIELNCIEKNTNLHDFIKGFTGINGSQIKPIIWIETLPLLLKLILRMNENKIIHGFSNKTINLTFENKVKGQKFGEKIRKAKSKLFYKSGYSIDIEQEKKYSQIMEILQ